ncbi:MAG: hypothetical protein M1830_001330 [Pleopsidium flavum]|nr:MAG: hypothetical protein M1830_001330 [Pleopsidium flavum]
MALAPSNSRINPASTGLGLKLTSSFNSNKTGTKLPSRGGQHSFALSLQRVIGTTTSSPNGFDCLAASRTFVLIAGSAAILAFVDENDNVSQRFFRARPSAAPMNPYNSSYAPTTPTRGPDSRSRTAASLKDGGLGAFCSGSPHRDSADSPSQRTWTARERIKAATCVSLSPDGKFLATGYNPRVLIFSTAWDAPSDIPLSILSEHTFGIRCIAFSPDSNFCASVGHMNDGFLYIWAINAGNGSARLCLSNKCTSYVRGIAWMGNSLITVGTRHVKVWRVEALSTTPSKPRFHVDGLPVGTPASPAPKILSGRNCLLGPLVEATFTCVASLSVDKAIVCSERGDVCLLDDSGKTQRLSRVADVGFSVHCMAIDGEGDSANAWFGGKHGIARAIALSELTRPKTPPELPVSGANSPLIYQGETPKRIVAMGCVGARLITVDSDHCITIAGITTTNGMITLSPGARELPAHRDAVNGVRSLCHPNEVQSDFFTWSAGGSVLLWSLDGQCKASLTVDLEQQSDNDNETCNELVVVRAPPAGEYFVSGDKYGVLRVTNSNSRECTVETRAHGAEITDICIVDRRDTTTLIASCGRDRVAQLFRKVEDRLEHIQTFDDHVGSITQLLFLESGKKLLSCSSDRTIVIRELVSREAVGAVLVAYVPSRTLTLRVTPVSMAQPPGQTDTLVVSTIDRQIQQFDLSTGRSIQAFRASDQEGNESVVMDALVLWGNPVASHQLTLLAGVAPTDKSIRLYAYETSSLLTREYGHTEGVTGVALIEANSKSPSDPAKATLVSTGMDGTIMIWDVSPRSHSLFESVASVELSHNSSPAKELTAVKAPIRRILSKSELAEFFKVPNVESRTPIVPRAVNRSPPRMRRKTSRYTLASQPSIAAPPIPSNRQHPTPLLADSLGYRGSGERSLTPPSPNSARPRRPSFGSRSRTKSAGNVTEFGSLNMTTEQVCRTLRAYRKKLSTSTDTIPTENARDLETELALTAKAVSERTRRHQASSETTVGDLLDQYSDKLAQMIDERVAMSVAKQTRSDGPAEVNGGKQERPPDVDLVGEG